MSIRNAGKSHKQSKYLNLILIKMVQIKTKAKTKAKASVGSTCPPPMWD